MDLQLLADDLESIFGKPNGGNDNKELTDIFGKPNGGTDDGWLGNIKKGFVSGAANVVGGIADMAHIDSAGNYFNSVTDNNQRARNFDTIFSTDYLTDPSGLAYDVSNQLGSMAALAPAAIAAPEGLVGAGATRAGGLLAGLGSRKLAQWATGEAGQAALKTGLRWGTTSIPESMSEGGNTRRDMLDNGQSEGDATKASLKVFAENVPTLALSNSLEGMLLGGKLFKPAADAGEGIATRIAKAPLRVAPAAGAGALQQGVEELLQQTYQDSAEGNPVGNPLNPSSWSDAQRQAFEVGMAGSFVLGSAAGGYRATRKNNSLPSADVSNVGGIDTNDTQVDMPGNVQNIIDNAGTNQQDNQPATQAQGEKAYNITGEVSDTGLTGGTEQKLNNLSAAFQQQFGEPLNVTSMKRHGDGSSWHDSGQAFDIAGGIVESSPEARQWLMDNAGKFGLTGLDEYANPSENATGGHIHFSDHEGGDGGQSSAQGKFGYNIAEMISQQIGLNPDLVWAQMYHETGGFDSALAKEDHNYAGIKNPDGSYRHFDSDADFANYQARNLSAYKEDGLFDAKTPEEYAAALKHGGYFEDSTDNYANGMRSALNSSGGAKNSYSSTSAKTSNDSNVFSDKIIDFANYMKDTSTDPETINFFEDKFNSKDKFIDTQKNRQDIEQQYGDQFQQWMKQQQDIQQYQQQEQPVQQQTPVQQVPQVKQQPIDIKTPSIDTIKINKMLADTKITDLANRALQGDTVAINALNNLPVPQREALMQSVQNMNNTSQETAQQDKTGQPIQSIQQQKGDVTNENNQSTNTKTAQSINTENQNANAVSGQSNVQTEAQINPSNEINSLKSYISALQGHRESMVNDMLDYYKKNPGGQGVEQGNLITDPATGEVTGRFGRQSKNPLWYQAAWKEFGHKPNKSELRQFAEKQLEVDPNFNDINSEIEAAQNHLDDLTKNTANNSQDAAQQDKSTKAKETIAPEEKASQSEAQETKAQARARETEEAEAADAKAVNYITGKYDGSKPVVLKSKSGKNGIVIAKSPREDGKYQGTEFDKNGYSNDFTRDNFHDAVVEAVNRGYAKSDSKMLDRMAKLDSFNKGNVETLTAKQAPQRAENDKSITPGSSRNKLYSDKSGKPITFYHGTRGDFSEFDNEKTGGLINFSDKKSVAEKYAVGDGGGRLRLNDDEKFIIDHDGNVYEKKGNDWVATGYSDDNNYKNIDRNKTVLGVKLGEKLSTKELGQIGTMDSYYTVLPKKSTIKEVHLKMNNPLNVAGDPAKALPVFEKIKNAIGRKGIKNRTVENIIFSLKQNGGSNFWATTKYESATKDYKNIIVPELKQMGYDGLIFPDDDHKTFAVFDANQVVSIAPVQEKEQAIQSPTPEEKTAQEKPAEPTAASKNNENRFGNEQEAEDDMLKAFGIEKKPESKKAFNVIDDSDDALAKALKEFNSELSNISSTPMFNPKLMTAAFKIGMIHLQRGLNDFAEWSKEMVKTSPQLKPFLGSVWDSVNAYPKDIKFDENKMSAVMRYVGTQYDKGITDKEELRKQLTDKIGAEYAGLIDPAYAGVVKFPTKEEMKNVNDSTSTMAERTGKGTDQNTVGANDAGEGTGSGSGQSLQPPDKTESPARSSARISDSGTAVSGKTGDSAVQKEKSENRTDSAGSSDLSRSVSDSYEGQSFIDDGRTAADIKSTENGRNNEAVAKPVTKEDKKTATAVEEIQKALPMLLPEQASDVQFAEERLFKNNGTGVLFTNGTGTGKTFTGLGVVKRFVDSGKNNILIISPSNDINNSWVKSGEKYFGLNISPLESTSDAGKGIVVTTYANMGYNNKLVNRDWDLVVADEAHTLMSSEKGDTTETLKNLRAITFHENGFFERFERIHADENEEIRKLREQAKEEENPAKKEALEQKISKLYNELDAQRREITKEWQQIPEEKKPKVVFLSATPFAYVPDIDYAEGYLFKYPKSERGGYNSPDGRGQFFMQNFGYRMRYNKLTRPEGSVNSSTMEVMFHQNLRNQGVLSGRAITVDKDYDRGFILVDGGVGKKIDAGFDWLSKKENGMEDLGNYMRQNFKGNAMNYLLEAVKAKGAIPLIKQYVESGKKVVVFHGYKKGGSDHPFRLTNVPEELMGQYQRFTALRPDLVNLKINDLQSPIIALKQAFGSYLLVYNGDVSKKERQAAIELFNDDGSGKNIILVQNDAGQAGISLHDTTGKHQRVLMNLGMPTKPVAAIQIEGRIYRVGQKSDAIFRYLNTGTNMEKYAFANKIAERASTAENLALGTQARDLKNAFVSAFEDSMDGDEWRNNLPGSPNEGKGGKEKDRTVNTATSEFDKAKTFYYAQQKKNQQTKAQEGRDYFATPEPLGYKMVEWANLKPGDSVLEPSGGHGAIARWFPTDTKNVAIEPSDDLAPRLKMAMDGGEVVNGTFENYYVGNKFDAVVMNPPFGTGGKTAMDHVAKAFKHLKDGGRLVAVIPDGSSMQKRFDKWLYGDESSTDKSLQKGQPTAFLMKTVNIPGVAFERSGTKINTKVVIIDKQETAAGKEKAAQYQQGQYDIKADNVNDFFDKIENIGAPTYTVDRQVAETKPETFKEDTHTHTKTGDIIPAVAITRRLTDPEYVQAKKVANSFGGYYNRYAKKFLFKTEDGRNKFLKEYGVGQTKTSERDDVEQEFVKKVFSELKMIPDYELSKREKAIQNMGNEMGVPVQFFTGYEHLHGYFRNGVSYINRKSAIPVNWVFWHESFHWLRNNNPALYSEVVDHIRGSITKEQLDEYRQQTGRLGMDDEETIEELIADAMPDMRKRMMYFREIGEKNKSLLQKLIDWFHDTLDKYKISANKVDTGLSKEQIDDLSKFVDKLSPEFIDAEGRKMFGEYKGTTSYSEAHNSEQILNSMNKKDRYSVEISNQDQKVIDEPLAKLSIRIFGKKEKNDNIDVRLKQRNKNEIGSIDKLIASPSNIAERVPAFKPFYQYATNAMNKLTYLRSDFNRKYDAAMDMVKSKDDKVALYELLLQGDTEAKEWNKQELLDDGIKENVANAYIKTRQIMNKAYRLLNDARRRPQMKSETLTSDELEKLRNNKFVDIQKVTPGENGSLVTYKEYANWKKEYTVDDNELQKMKNDSAIQIEKEETAGVDSDGNKLYNLEVREGIPDLNKLQGYIPHFFHEYFIVRKDGEESYVVGSGRTVKEAVKKSEEYLKANPDAKLVVRPKQFDFSSVGLNKDDEERFAVTIGDKEYKRMMTQLAKDNDISLANAKEMMDQSVKKKNRHRFYGNFLQRTGAEGYEKNLDWVMRHFFNTSSRYVAMETEFKPKAISLFERLYGRFDDAHNNNATARYVKDYINDLNGNPTAVEQWFNDLLNNSKFWRNHVVSAFGDRAALQLANTVTNTVSVMKLGMLNVSSAMINLSQLANAAGLVGDTTLLFKALQKGAHRKYSPSDLKILVKSGVMNDIGMDSGSGYGKMSVGKLASRSMFFFKQSEGLVRRGTVLAAYEAGRKRGMSEDEAINYAKMVNRKANFDYGVNDAPNIFRRGSIISQIMLQFKKYPIKEFELMSEMLSSQTNPKQKAIFWGSYFLMAGLLQVPAVDWFDDLWEQIFGTGFKNKIKKSIFLAAGDDPTMKQIAKVAVYGIGSLANVDVSSRTGVGDAIPKLSEPKTWMGASVSSIVQPLMYAKNGDWEQAMKTLSPGVANILMAITGQNVGSRDRIMSKYDSDYERVLRGLGFKSVDESIAADKQSILYDDRKDKEAERKAAIDAYLKDSTTENAAKLKELGVTPKAVKQERMRKEMDRSERNTDTMSHKERKQQYDLLNF